MFGFIRHIGPSRVDGVESVLLLVALDAVFFILNENDAGVSGIAEDI